MPRHILYTILIESTLVAITVIFLVQPKFILNVSSEKIQKVFTVTGLVLLCITFCWSFILGCILAISQMTIQF